MPSSPNSEPEYPTSATTTNLGTQTTEPITSLATSSPESPLETLFGKLVHDMTNEELVTYIKECAALRSSAQTRRAALVKEGTVLGAEKTPRKKAKPTDSVAEAMALLDLLTKG